MTYRKKKDREFFRVDGETVTRVVNKFYESTIEVSINQVVKWNATDPYDTKDCTELEFKNAYRTAIDRISLGKIL